MAHAQPAALPTLRPTFTSGAKQGWEYFEDETGGLWGARSGQRAQFLAQRGEWARTRQARQERASTGGQPPTAPEARQHEQEAPTPTPDAPQPPPPSGAPGAKLPEAPASATLRVTWTGGYEVLFTMRDVSAGGLIDKIDRAVKMFQERGIAPAGAPRGSGSTPGATPAPASGNAPVCPTHGVPMKPSKHKGFFCPQKVAEDDGAGRPVYCKQKVG